MKIAITGKIRSGKDTIADILKKEGYKEFKFSAGIREVIQKYFPKDWEKGKPRHHYQHIGQSMRELDSDVWINYTLNQVDEYLKANPHGNVVISDMRQINEADRLRDEGYIIVKVVASKEARVKRMIEAGDTFTEESLEHDTEKQSDMIVADIVIRNEGTIEELIKTVEAFNIK